MKDKLVKTGHKKAYYKARMFSICFVSFAAFIGLAITPIIVAQQIVEIRKAEEEVVATIEQNDATESLPSYVDQLED